jgi:hypothetical protein
MRYIPATALHVVTIVPIISSVIYAQSDYYYRHRDGHCYYSNGGRTLNCN